MNDPPGLGMSWRDAIEAGPVALRFLMADEASIKAMSQRMRSKELQQRGVTPEDVRNDVKRYMAERRKRYTGKASRDEV